MERVISGHKKIRKNGWENQHVKKTEKPYSGSDKESIQSATVEKKIRQICKKLPQAFAQHSRCIVWFWLVDAL